TVATHHPMSSSPASKLWYSKSSTGSNRSASTTAKPVPSSLKRTTSPLRTAPSCSGVSCIGLLLSRVAACMDGLLSWARQLRTTAPRALESFTDAERWGREFPCVTAGDDVAAVTKCPRDSLQNAAAASFSFTAATDLCARDPPADRA